MGKNYKRNYLLLVAITVAVLSISGVYFIKSETEKILNEKYSDLALVAKIKVEEISASIQDEMEDALLISKDVFLQDRINNFIAKQENNRINLRNYIQRIMSEHGYEDIVVLSKIGKILFAVKKNIHEKFNPHLTKCIEQAINEKKVVYTDLHWSLYKNIIRFDYVAPILDEKRNVVAAIILRKDPHKSLFLLIQTWPTNSKTAENLLIRREGDTVLFLNELRHKKDTALKYKIPLSDTLVPAVKAVLGKTGLIEGKDYRGIDVLTDVRTIPNTNWFMVTKIDQDEIFAELKYRTALSVVIILLLIFFTVLSFAVLHYYRTRKHIKELLVKEKAVTSAKEEFRTTLYSIGDGVITTDKNANVKQMNSVAEKLTGWKEYDAAGKPIQEVFKIINEDSRNTVENPVERVLREGKIVGLANHTLLISKDGKETPIADSGAPIKQQYGEIEGVVLVFRDQTEERDAKKQLTESETKYRSIFDNDKMIMLIINPLSGNIVEANSGAEIFYGWTKEQLLKMNINQINTLTPDEIKRKMKEVQKTHMRRFEFKHRKADSSIVDVEVIRGDIRIAEEDLFYIIINDITDKKKFEAEQFRMAKLIENSLNEIYIFDADTLKFEYVNYGALQNIQYTLNEMKLLTPVDIKPLINEEEFNKIIQPLRNGDVELLVFETTHRRKNGTDYLVEVHLQLYKDSEKKLFFAIINDITQKKYSEKALRESEEQFRKMFQVASVGIVQVLPDEGRIVNCNEKYCEILGYTKEELINIPFRDLTYAEDRKKDWEIFLAAARGETPNYLNEKRYVRKDGSLIWVRINAAFIRDDNNKVIKTVAVVEDISDRKNMEVAIQKRILALTQPISAETEIKFEDIFNIDELQQIQDAFSSATGVASLITYPDGTPITKPSNFCFLCNTLIRGTEKGRANCKKSDTVIGARNPDGPTIHPCFSGGLWDAGASITVGGVHLANWLVGQVRNEEIETEKIIAYADEIGADREEFRKALDEVTVMTKEKFEAISKSLYSFAKELSLKAYQNFQQARVLNERDLLNKELHNREQNLSVTLQSIGDGVIVTDTNGLVINMNFVAEKLTGYTLKESKGKQLTDVFNIVNAQTRNKVENPVERVIREGEIVGLANHTVLISKNGEEYQIADSAAPIKEKNENIIGVVLVFRDQTEEYKAQQQLQENERKFRMIFETSPDAIVISHIPSGKYVDVNEGFCKMSGYSYQEALGKTSAELGLLVNPHERELIISSVQKDGKADNVEVVYRKKNGDNIICYTSASFLEINEAKYLFSVSRDVTEKIMSAKEIERYKNHLEGMIDERTQQLNLANKQLSDEIQKEKEVEAKLEENLLREKELNLLKSRFVSTTSHEFRTPLTTVLSSAELIQKGLGKVPEEKILNYASRIKNSVSYLTRLLDDVITLNRAESGKLKNEPKKIDLKELCDEIIETTQCFSKDNHRLHFDFQSEENYLLLDDKLMRFIISNLLVNAFKYSPDGGLISLVVKNEGKDLIIKVMDEGIGIPEDDKIHLFEPFHRSSISADIPGTGLGLSIVQRSVEIQNGKIAIDSEVNKGTTFTITIPKN